MKQKPHEHYCKKEEKKSFSFGFGVMFYVFLIILQDSQIVVVVWQKNKKIIVCGKKTKHRSDCKINFLFLVEVDSCKCLVQQGTQLVILVTL